MNTQRGFALTELLVAIAVLALILTGLVATLRSGQAAYGFGAARAEVQQNARVALERILHELRTATGVSVANGDNVTFQFVNDLPLTNPNRLVTVQYSLNGTNLQRNQTAPVVPGQPETLVGGVSAFALTYYDVKDAVTTTPGSVYSVQITMTARSESAGLTSASPAQRQAVVEGRVKLRNL